MKVVGEGLVIPFQLTRRLIELDDTIRVQFATGGRLRLLEREIGIANARVDRVIRADQHGIPGTTRGRFELLTHLIHHGLETPERGTAVGVEGIDNTATNGDCRRDKDPPVSYLWGDVEVDLACREMRIIPHLSACLRIKGEHSTGCDAVEPAIG